MSVSSVAQRIDIEQILERLQGVRKTARGWSARCPAHDDRSPSLSVALGNDGRILLYCWSGCTFQEIAQALGFQPGDLSPGRPQPRTPEERQAAVEQERMREQNRELEAWAHRAYVRLAAYRRCLWLVLETPDDMRADYCDRLSYVDDILDLLQFGTLREKQAVQDAAQAGALGLLGVVIAA